MSHLTERGYHAAAHLIRSTHLADLPPIQAAFDPERRTLNPEPLEDWPWSTGERVLVDLLLAIHNCYHAAPTVGRLATLDPLTCRAALEALALWLVHDDREAWQ